MAPSRLTDSQKNELVERFRAGESSQELADAFGCSANTVIRVVKAALEPAEYERLKQQRARRGGRAGEAAAGTAAGMSLPLDRSVAEPAEPAAAADEAQAADEAEDEVELEEDAEDEPEDEPSAAMPPNRPRGGRTMGAGAGSEEDGPGVLAIDDADDFAEEEDDLLGEEDAGEEDATPFLAIPLAQALEDHLPREPEPLSSAAWPASVYMLVDKTVELQARPLREFPELGRLAADEEERQALALFINPRQAKRQCGRTQRVIKLPDPRVLERTAPYLLAQGISRVVVEGSLYALPGS